MSTQKDLNGDDLPEHLKGRQHLTMVKPSNPSTLTADERKSEAWCLMCACRITVGTGEWGHAKDCPHHDQLAGDGYQETEAVQYVPDQQTHISGVDVKRAETDAE